MNAFQFDGWLKKSDDRCRTGLHYVPVYMLTHAVRLMLVAHIVTLNLYVCASVAVFCCQFDDRDISIHNCQLIITGLPEGCLFYPLNCHSEVPTYISSYPLHKLDGSKDGLLRKCIFLDKKVFAIAGEECRFTTLSIFMGVNRCVFFKSYPVVARHVIMTSVFGVCICHQITSTELFLLQYFTLYLILISQTSCS